MNITVTAYFEICDSVLYGGKGSKIYTKMDLDCEIEDVNKDLEEIIEDFRKNLADSCSVDEKKVRLVKRTEALEYKRTSKEMGEWLEKRDRNRDIRVRADERNKTIDECIKIISRETHSGTLIDYLEELKKCGKNEQSI